MQMQVIPFWKKSPILRLLPFFISGIITADLLETSWRFSLLAGSLTALLILIYGRLRYALQYRLQNIRGVFILLLIFISGMCISALHRIPTHPKWFGKHTTAEGYQLRVIEMPERTTRYFRCVAEVTATHTRGSWHPSKGKTFVYFPLTGKVPEYGMQFVTPVQPIPIAGAKNPAGFDFEKYAARKNIHCAFYLKDEITNETYSPHPFKKWILQCRTNVLATLRQFIPNDETLGIAEALLIGYRDNLDDSLMDAYSSTGVVHVIAISGLHLGLIYAVLLALFNRITIIAKRPTLKCIIVLCFLWWFSLITGGSASVLRSAVMFTCLLSGTTWFSQSGGWNALGASALLLLVYDPYFLWDAGFLLSYAAVAGLMGWQSPLFRKVFFRNKMLRHVWNMASVTIAAQLAAFPLCLYYFHQFPNYFLLANLLVVPLSTIILFAELALLFLQFFATTAAWCAALIHTLIKWMNNFIIWCNDLPAAVTEGVFADEWSTFLLYAFIITALGWVLLKKRWAILSLTMLLIFAGYISALNIYHLHHQTITVYHQRKGLSIDITRGRQALNITDTLKGNMPWSRTAEGPARTSRMIKKEKTKFLPDSKTGSYILDFPDCRLVIISNGKRPSIPESNGKPTFLLITGNPMVRLPEIVQRLKPKSLIITADNPTWKNEQWKKECEGLNLRCISISERGALEFNPDQYPVSYVEKN